MQEQEIKSELAEVAIKANSNMKLARGLYVQKYGISSIIRPKFIFMQLSRLSMALAKPLAITVIIGIIICGALFYGVIEATYGMYFLKAIGIAFVNVLLTVLNALVYAVNALTELLKFGFAYMLNNMMYYFLYPIVEGINMISDAVSILPYVDTGHVFVPEIGEGLSIALSPPFSFSYMVPDAVIWGDWGSALSFKFIHAGANMYTGEMISVVSQNGAELLFPQISTGAIAESFWSATNPESIPFTTISPNVGTFMEWSGTIIEEVTTGETAQAWSWSFLMGPISWWL